MWVYIGLRVHIGFRVYIELLSLGLIGFRVWVSRASGS